MTQFLVDYTSMYSSNVCDSYLSSGKVKQPKQLFYLLSPQEVPLPPSVWIKEHLVKCLLNQCEQRVLSYKDSTYTTLPDLIESLDIGDPSKWNQNLLDKISKIANFIYTGLQYTYIEDISSFKREQQDRIKNENAKHVCSIFSSTKYYMHALNLIHPPVLTKITKPAKFNLNPHAYELKFCVYDQNHIPYEVTANPLENAKPGVYEALNKSSYSSC